MFFCLFQDVASHCDVKCMPTFQFYKNGKKVGSAFLELSRQAKYLKEDWEWDYLVCFLLCLCGTTSIETLLSASKLILVPQQL